MMEDRTLYIGGQRVDLPENVSFNLVWQVAEPGELKIYGSGSSTITLPFTPANDKLFEYCKYLTSVGGRQFQTFPECRYYERGVLMIDDGTAYLVSVSDGYEICLTWGNGDLVQRLKDTPLYDKQIGTFKWDNSEIYPLAETSESPKDYPTFFTDEKGQLTMRLAMNRPLVEYTKVLSVSGINGDTVPGRIYDFVKKTYLQVNGTQAKGYYREAVPVETLQGGAEIASQVNGLDGASPTDDLYWLQGAKVGQVSIEQSGIYEIRIEEGFQGELPYDLPDGKQGYFRSFCIFITERDYGEDIQVGREPFIDNVFANAEGTAYEPVYRYEADAGGSGGTLFKEVRPVALAYSTKERPVTLMPVDDFGANLIGLQKKTYYIYIIPRASVLKVRISYDPEGHSIYQRRFEGRVFVDSIATFRETTVKDSATRIESPDDEILKTDPPDKITLLGYDNASQIAQDFITMFPLMCQATMIGGSYRLQYFGFEEVIANMPNAYDWSEAYVTHTKTAYGNKNVALKNHVKFAPYGDYEGFRADGVFESFSLNEAEKNYGELKRIANYDYVRDLKIRNINNYDVSAKAGEYPLSKVKEKEGVYSPGGLNSIPPVFFFFFNKFYPGFRGRVQIEGGGKAMVYYDVTGNRNTLEYIINGDPSNGTAGYWKTFLEIIMRQKTITVMLNIHPSRLQGFDFTRPIYLKQLSVYVFAQKITYKGGMSAELQGIILPSIKQEEPKPIEDGMLVDATDTYLVDDTDSYLTDNE